MYHRRGVSSILGTLVFIGILFSAVMPMFVTMRQADIYYEQEKMRAQRMDEERNLEDVEVYIAPTDTDFTLTLVNQGEIPVTIVRVWENEHNTTLSELLPIQTSSELAPIEFSHAPAENETFEIRVTTERGNTFLNENGVLTYGPGEWMMEKFYINIHAGGIFMHVKVTDVAEGTVLFDEWDMIGVGYQVEVPTAGPTYLYHVLVEKSSWWSTVTLFDDDVTIDWPPETFVDVYPD